MPKSRKRKKKQAKGRGRSGASRPAAPTLAGLPVTGLRLDPALRAAAAAMPEVTRGHVASAIGKLVAAVPSLDAVIREDLGIPPNICVEACRWLHYAYAQLGIQSVLTATGLVVSGRSGNAILRAPTSPSWDGTMMDGHAVLCLPEVRRFVDPTVEQYPEVARYRIGPVSGLAAGQHGGTAVRPAPFVPGDQLVVQRKNLTLVYTLGGQADTQVIMGHWVVRDRAEVHRRAGINLATLAVDYIRTDPELREAAIPRLHVLLTAVGDSPVRHDPGTGDWLFDMPEGQLRLDELPLPPGTPAPAQEDPGLGLGDGDPGPEASSMGSGLSRLIMPPRLKSSRLTRGWPGPGGTILRMARPGESSTVLQFAAMAGGELDQQVAAAIDDGTAGSALARTLDGGKDAATRTAAEALCGGTPAPLAQLATILVAEHGGQVVAALCAVPPVGLITQLMERGLEAPYAIVASLAMTKIEAVAVDKAHRGQGIASALLGGCVELYDRLDYLLIFGALQPASGLADFFSARSFDVQQAGHGLDLEVIVGRPCLLSSDSGEQLFMRWRHQQPARSGLRQRWRAG